MALLALFFTWDLAIGKKIFSHNDVFPNYFALRSWMLSQIKNGEWPFWNPYLGFGRISEAWATIPLDWWTPFQLIFGFSNHVIYIAEMAVVIAVAQFTFGKILSSGWAALVATTTFLFLPNTQFVIYYFNHSNAYILMLLLLMFSLNFFESPSRKLWLALACVTALFIPGAHLAATLNLIILFFCSSIFFVFTMSREPPTSRIRKLYFYLSAIFSGLALSAWYVAYIQISAASSIRNITIPWTWIDFANSYYSAIVSDSFIPIEALLLLTCFRSPIRRLLKNEWFYQSAFIAILIFALVFIRSILVHFFSETLSGLGFIAAIVYAAYVLRRDFFRFEEGTALSLLVIYYFGRPGDGIIGELVYLNSLSSIAQFFVTFLAVTTFYISPKRLAVRYGAFVMATAFFMRHMGTPLLNYSIGAIWLPMRDNFIIDAALSMLVGFGAFEICRRSISAHMSRIVFVGLGMCMIPSIQNVHKVNPGVAPTGLPSDFELMNSDAHEIAQSLKFPHPNSSRIFDFYHSYNMLYSIGDVREYASFPNRKYTELSISKRLGIPISALGPVGAITGGYPQELLSMLKPSKVITTPLHPFQFYYHYVVHALPPLDCNWLKLMGVAYFRKSAVTPNKNSYALFLANGYSIEHNEFNQRPPFAEDVNLRLAKCMKNEVHLTGGDFWTVREPMPRTFIIKNLEEDLTAKVSESISPKVTRNALTLDDGSIVSWEKVHGGSYSTNKIRLYVDTDQPGLLILTDAIHPYWHATINGKVAPIIPAFSIFRGVKLYPGSNEIIFSTALPNRLRLMTLAAIGLSLAVLNLRILRLP